MELGAQVAQNAAWPLPACPCGIIAGTASLAGSPLSWLTTVLRILPEGGDGTVSIPETRLPPDYETDFATVYASHRFVISNRQTLPLILNFLQYHKFHAPEDRQ